MSDLYFLIINLFKFVINYYYIVIIILLILFLIFYQKQDNNFYWRIIYNKWYSIISWLFWNWKTQLLTELAKIWLDKWFFIISNFYNWYSFLNYSSKKDLQNLLSDLLILWEYQNFSDSEFTQIYDKKIYANKHIERKSLKWYKFLQNKNNKFICLWDEFHIYFDSRERLKNFKEIKVKIKDNEKELQENFEEKKENLADKKLSITMHQIRHFNTSFILATQKVRHLDNRIRELRSYEIESKNHKLLKIYDLYKWFNEKRTETEKEFYKINKLPIIKFNSYELNFLVANLEKLINKFLYNDKYIFWIIVLFLIIWYILFNIYIYTYIIIRLIFILYISLVLYYQKYDFDIKLKRFSLLKFNTKFNVNPTYNIYNKWDLFVKLNEYYKEKENIKKDLTI